MTNNLNQQKTKEARRTRPLGNLVIWLLLVPVVFGTLILFSELALIINLEDLVADTRSLLQAQYQAWPYDEIPPINIAAFFSDIQKEIEQLGTPVGTPTIQEGTFLVPPTPLATEIVQSTPIPETPVPTDIPTNEPIINTPTKATPSRTPSRIPSTATLQATRTSAPTATTQIILPTLTLTPELDDTRPPSTATHTITPTTTTAALTPTFTMTITLTLEYAPVRPIAENNGESIVDPEGQGCLAYFGYRNDNPVEIDIPIGDRNHLSETPVRIDPEPEQPTHFYTDRVSPAFEVVWNNPVPFTWYLDGREAVVQWCNP